MGHELLFLFMAHDQKQNQFQKILHFLAIQDQLTIDLLDFQVLDLEDVLLNHREVELMMVLFP